MKRIYRSALQIASISQLARAFVTAPKSRSCASSSALWMSPRNRGLEIQNEGAAPEPGGMLLYVKAGPEGTDIGDCPFSQYVRLVLEEKGLEYQVQPATPTTKPNWLIEHYDGKMPALRHRKECYIESDIISEYLEFFFPNPRLKPPRKQASSAEDAVGDFFPSMAKYIKTAEGEDDAERSDLQANLSRLDTYLATQESSYICGDEVSIHDCSLAPKLHHFKITTEEFKSGQPSLDDYPALAAYYDRFSQRQSFQNTVCPPETIVWGWENARN